VDQARIGVLEAARTQARPAPLQEYAKGGAGDDIAARHGVEGCPYVLADGTNLSR
jgi:hypothetical protein